MAHALQISEEEDEEWARIFRESGEGAALEYEQGLCVQRAPAVLEFVNRYGLLGLFYRYAMENVVMPDGQAFIVLDPLFPEFDPVLQGVRGSGHSTNLMPFEKYVDVFTPDWSGPKGFFPYTENMENFPHLSGLYAEPLDLFIRSVSEVYECFLAAQDYDRAEGESREELARFLNEKFGVGPLGVRISVGEVTRVAWRVRSLIELVALEAVLNFAERDQTVRTCKLPECGRTFIAKSKKKEFCERRHYKRHHARQERAKNGENA